MRRNSHHQYVQSSPTPKGGRYEPVPSRNAADLAFQSSPTPKGGRYVPALPSTCAAWSFQSSPTPKGGRYVSLLHRRVFVLRFNPHPPRRVGATAFSFRKLGEFLVSILTHPEGWALPPNRDKGKGNNAFQSSPTPKGGRYSRPQDHWPARCMFQSSPTPKGGRYPDAVLLAGLVEQVSILTHPEGWALPACNKRIFNYNQFQSSPTPKGGRYECLCQS